MSELHSFPSLHRHPGPEAPERFYRAAGHGLGPHRLCVEPGTDVYESITRWTRRMGVDTAAFQLLHGTVRELEVMTGRSDLDAGRVATFHGPHVVECPARVLGGHGAIGVLGNGTRLHTHAVFLDARGRARGCHLVPGHCIAGSEPIVLAMYPLTDARFRVIKDAETDFDLFFPETVSDAAASASTLS